MASLLHYMYPRPRIEPPQVRKPTKYSLDRLAAAQRLRTRYDEVQRRFRNGESLRAISRATGLSRKTVRKYARSLEVPRRAPGRSGPRKLGPFVRYLQERWQAGCTNASRLFREIAAMGYEGGLTQLRDLVRPWRTTLGPSATTEAGGSSRRPNWRDVRWAILCPPEHRRRGQQELAQRFLALHPDLRDAHDLVQRFRRMLRDHAVGDFDHWMEQARVSRFPSFRRLARTFAADLAAIRAAIELPWSTGRVEGHITRVKLIKQIGYGRAGLALLRARILGVQSALAEGSDTRVPA